MCRLLCLQFLSFEMEPKRVQLSLPEKNAIPALHKAGLKGPTIARETRLLLPAIYGVLKRFKQRVTKGNKDRSGKPPLLTLYVYRARPVSYRTVQRKLYETKYHKWVVKKGIRIRDYNVKTRLVWCKWNRYNIK
jgi:hypothetical protein